jgi:hypothetical protein
VLLLLCVYLISLSLLLQALPKTHQCYDWSLVYRMSMHGASLSSLVHKSKGSSASLLVVQDAQGAVFGALITESLKVSEKDKYYGNGTIGVWSFNTGQLKVSLYLSLPDSVCVRLISLCLCLSLCLSCSTILGVIRIPISY